jgi:antitoxin component of MazEF toxin-antitoxin module
MIKRLIKHGNSRAIVVDKAMLEAAGIAEDALFQVTINPNGGLIIQSLEDDAKNDVAKENFKKLNKKYRALMQRLADL